MVEMVKFLPPKEKTVAESNGSVAAMDQTKAAQAELDRLQERVLELETELGHRSWNPGDFYRLPTVSSAPAVVGQVVTLAENGRPFQVIEAAEPDLMASVPTVRELRAGLAPNVIGCDEPTWWPL